MQNRRVPKQENAYIMYELIIITCTNLSCNLCLWYYDQLVHFDKEINANVYRQSLWEYS